MKRAAKPANLFSMNTVDGATKFTFNLGGDLSINRLGFGAMRVTGEGVWGNPPDLDEAGRVLRRTVELGINFIDTADAYGPDVSEDLIRQHLHPYPSNLVIATKGGLTRQGPGKWSPVGRPEYLTQCVEMSLRRLRMERIDLYQLHRIDGKVPVEESLGALRDLQKAGKIRHIGLSEVKPDEIERAKKTVEVVSVQNKYNIGDRTHEDTLQYCQKNGIAFIPWAPVASGKLAKEGGPLDSGAKQHKASLTQLCLAWLLQHSPVMIPIPGTSSVKHLEQNTEAQNIDLSDAEWKALENAAAR